MDYATIRPPTPDSPLTNRDSLYDATTTIDDLTNALNDVSRVPSPEPPSLYFCCCGRDDCENVQAWLATKARLESRLMLSAEVGQALLQRHEAYVRRHESESRRREASASAADEDKEDRDGAAAEVQDRLDELTKENKALEKRLTQALVNNEVTEVSNKTILVELADAKTTISRLTASAARSVGWDTRLSAAMKEKEDMQQERDAESQRARLAEGRFAQLKERMSKLQADVRRLQNALEEKREHRLELSESILVDARARLEALQRSVGGASGVKQDGEPGSELHSILQSLVDDNETLKHDNAELQTALQEEVEDQRVNPPPRSGAGTPSHLRQHFHTGSVPSALAVGQSYGFKRSSSNERDRRTSRRYEPLTPETSRRPLSPADSATSDTRWTYFGQPQPRYPVSPSRASFEMGLDRDGAEDGQDDTLEKRTPHKPLFLLARSRGVQTDPYPMPASPTPGPSPYPPSHSPLSSATPSVYSDSLGPNTGASATANTSASANGNPASLAAMVERTQALLQRMQAADALSLTNRLKRAGIRGADVGHLSRSTVAGILSDANKQLRNVAGADEELRAGRREVRSLLGVLREMFGAMGEIRVVLNEVVLDPSSATRVSEAAMDPNKARKAEEQAAAAAAGEGKGGDAKSAGWMAPLSKLFAGAPRDGERERTATTSPLLAPRPMPPRFVPKLGPALAASATTVNVEFSGAGSGVGRAMTSTIDAAPTPAISIGTAGGSNTGVLHTHQGTPGVMGIFAGAPVRTRTPDPWVVIPRTQRAPPGALLSPAAAAVRRQHPNRMSRNVDAVLDGVGTPVRQPGSGDASGDEDEGPDYLAPLLQRTLRRRGLSDSSIHSTFAAQAAEDEADGTAPPQSPLTRTEAAWLESGSVLQALSRRVQSFRSGLNTEGPNSAREGASHSSSELGASPPAPPAPIATSGHGVSRRSSRASRPPHDASHSPLKTTAPSSGFGFLANLVPSGEAAAEMARSLREQDDAMLARTYRAPGGERDYV
ncbi:hypothetical protein MVEN_01185800 [Mycena venus]|uniref:Uncharacterized protein n=1 Tax=Mycena venus TaxID=2733690 RepID=A0A8H7CVN4_9AGAR|nr:hypothetical protein MVEN_01185800 [Mycena venus]